MRPEVEDVVAAMFAVYNDEAERAEKDEAETKRELRRSRSRSGSRMRRV